MRTGNLTTWLLRGTYPRLYVSLVAIILLGRQAFLLLVDYVGQRRRGIKNPVYTRDRIPSLEDKAECW